jgi:transcriptional regulator with GAF, ATPase, and Fis domain
MLWVTVGDDSGLVSEVERRTGLTAKVAEGRCSALRGLDRAKIVVLRMPLEREVVGHALTSAAKLPEPLPVVILDPARQLDEMLVLPSMTRVHHLTSEDPVELVLGVQTALEASANFRANRGSDELLKKLLVGESQPMRDLQALIRLVAPRNSTVLISGESGTGKELVARAIHALSVRCGADMVAINCGALPEDLIEAELFGHTKGAFTGASNQRLGRFEQANGSTLFLDEIGELPLSLQAKMLRVLQERELQRLGSSETIKINARIIAATNTDLAKAVAQKRFREDLYYRLNVVPIHVPPLRVRRSDIPVLANHFIEQVCQREGMPSKVLSVCAIARLLDYSWPGNVRQLEHAIEMAVTLSGSRRQLFLGDIQISGPPVFAEEETGGVVAGPLLKAIPEGIRFEEFMSWVERQLLDQALQNCGGNKAKAASLLGMKRTTLLYKMKAAGYVTECAG